MRIVLSLLVLCFAPVALSGGESPYVSFQSRPIKALSDADIRAYREAAGMGLALAAELNGYPGPKHVLELAAELELTPSQKTKVQQVFDRMQRDALRIGEEIIEAERTLDAAFREADIDGERLEKMTAAIASGQGRLRSIHLLAHIEMRALLTQHQLYAYERLRGYSSGGADHSQHHSHKH